MAFECVSKTDVGLRRKVNEDSLLVRTERGLWAVADGMGGHDAGDVASSKVTECLLELPDSDDLDQLVESAVAALKKVNQDLILLAGARETAKSIGSTVVGLAIADDQFRCFWAGDSRGYRIRDGQIVQLTRDHSLVQDLVDSGMLQPENVAQLVHDHGQEVDSAQSRAAVPRDEFVLPGARPELLVAGRSHVHEPAMAGRVAVQKHAVADVGAQDQPV